MLTDLRIRHYRLFNDLTIRGLKRVNLFIGKNNSGKSTVLEAAALLAGDHSPGVLDFRDLDASKELVITATDASRNEWSLTATVKRSSVSTVTGDRPEVNFSVDPPPGPSYGVGYVPNNVGLVVREVEVLSRLRRDQRTEVVLDVLRRIEPRIRGVPEVLMIDGEPRLYCDIGAGRLLPLELMGQGLVRALRLVLALEHVSPSPTAGKLLMIDEIENGMHHEALVDTWLAVDEASRRSGTQVFATTHSYECLQSASKAVSSKDLAMHRLEVDEGRTVRCVTLDSEAIEATMRHGFEVR